MLGSPNESVIFDRAVEYYDQTRGFPLGVDQQVAQLFRRAGNLTRASRLIEIGIGTGRISLPLAPYADNITGIDLSRPMMNRLKAKQATEHINLIEGDISRLPIVTHQFDAAVAVHIFHLVPTWQAALLELARVLKPDAPLLLGNNGSTPAQEPIWTAMLEAMPIEKQPDVGARIKDDSDFVQTAGWRFVSQEAIVYNIDERLQDFIDGARNRIWSRTWRLTEAEATHCADAVRAAIEVHFGNPQQTVRFETRFDVRVYLPPAVAMAR